MPGAGLDSGVVFSQWTYQGARSVVDPAKIRRYLKHVGMPASPLGEIDGRIQLSVFGTAFYRKARENKSEKWSGSRAWKEISVVRLHWLKDDESSAKQINFRSVS